MDIDTSLDDLFKEARAAFRKDKIVTAKRKAAEPEADPDTQGLYRNPANWIKGRSIALIHSETQTLLGNFAEYNHRTVADARRLVREATSSQADCVEYVSGDWWMIPQEAPKARRLWKESKLLTLPFAHLTHLGVSAQSVSVYAVFGEGCLDRVDLAGPTIFGGGSSLLTLPAGVDIMRELTPITITQILTKLEQPHD